MAQKISFTVGFRLSKGMDADLKKMIAAGTVLLMLICIATVSASTGSIDNPLITRSYLDGAFADSLRSDAASAFDNAMDRAMSRLDDIYRNYMRYNFSPRFSAISLAGGDTLTLSSGGSFILLSGTAALTLTSGTVMNISAGSEVPSGSVLIQYQRYFCTENTTCVITADSALTGQVDGYYLASNAGAPVPDRVFADVSETDWFFTAVDYVYKRSLFAGTSANMFSPAMPMTRGMFVTVLYRLDGRPEPGAGGDFADVIDPSLYYYDAVAWANANRIVTGYTDGTFQPDRSITREEMAAIMYRYAAYKGRNMQTPGDAYDTFPDNGDVSSYADAAMRWSVSWEIIRGSNGSLLPKNTATRAEVAQIIYNYCENIG